MVGTRQNNKQKAASVMGGRKIILSVIFILTLQVSSAQLTPWWLRNPAVDSTDIKRRIIADSIVAYAKTFAGVPYVWGGCDPVSGFDCSGFIQYVYRKFGIELPRTSAEQFNAGIPIPYTNAEHGDLILFTGMESYGGDPGHVGIILSNDGNGNFTFIHTSSPESGGVRISTWNREKYYYKRFLEIRRVIIPK